MRALQRFVRPDVQGALHRLMGTFETKVGRNRLPSCFFGVAGGSSEPPFAQDPVGRGGLHLVGEALAIEGHEGIVGLVAGAAQGIDRQHDAKAQIDRRHHGRQHAHIGLAAGHDQGADSLATQGRRQARIGESGVDRLVQDAGRWTEAGERFGQLEQAGVQRVARHRPPVPVVVPPCAGHLLRHFRGE